MKIWHKLLLVPALVLAFTTPRAPGQSRFVSENADEFYTTADFNGDGAEDLVIVDRATGAYRIGYRQPAGDFLWVAARSSGVTNLTGFAVGNVLSLSSASLLFAQPDANRVNLLDASSTTAPGTPLAVYPPEPGPSLVAAIDVGGSGNTANDDLIVGTLYAAMGPRFTGLRSTGASVSAPVFDAPAPASFARGNAVTLKTGLPTFFSYLQRGPTDTFKAVAASSGTLVPAISLPFLPAGVDFVHANFTPSPLAQFLFYNPGQPNLLLYQVQEPIAGTLVFSSPTAFSLGQPVKQLFVVPMDTTNRLLVIFGQGEAAAMYDFDGATAPRLAQYFASATGELFTGAALLQNSHFMMFSSVGGGHSSTDFKTWNFSAGSYVAGASGKLPGLNRFSGGANVFEFQSEPFVNAVPHLLRELNAGDWSSSVSVSGGRIAVTEETFLGSTAGLGNPAPTSLGPLKSPGDFPIGNQYGPAISVFSLAPALGDVVSEVTISPPPGSYAVTLKVSFATKVSTDQVFYRLNSSSAWSLYNGAPFFVYQDTTISYYAQPAASNTRTPVFTAAYHFTTPFSTRDSNGNGTPDYVELGLGEDPTDAGNPPAVVLDGGGYADLILTPRPFDGTTYAASLDATDRVVTAYSPAGGLLATAQATNLFLTGVLTPSVGLSNLVFDPADRVFILGTERYYDIVTVNPDQRLGRELIGLAPVPPVQPVTVPYTLGSGSLAMEAAHWQAAANAALHARPLYQRQLDIYDTLIALLFEQQVSQILLARGTNWANNLTLFPFRTDDLNRTPVPDDLLTSLETRLSDTLPGWPLQGMLASLDNQVRNSTDPNIQKLAQVAANIYFVNSISNNTYPGLFASPVNALRDFLASGTLDPVYLSVTTRPWPDLAAAHTGETTLLASVQPRATVNLLLRVRADSFSGSCALLETTDPTPVLHSLVDGNLLPYRFAQTFILPAGTLVQVLAYSDAPASSCAGTPLQVITAQVLSIPLSDEIDSDHNNLIDTWEMAFFGHLGNLPDADPDGDGYSNYAEMLAGTDPTDPLSVPPGPQLLAGAGDPPGPNPPDVTVPPYYRTSIGTGLNLIANQLDHGSNSLNEILPSVPNGCVLSKFNNADQTWSVASYSAASHSWTPASIALNPGEGAFLQSPADFTLFFNGNPHVPVLPLTNLASGVSYLLSRQTNDIGTFENITGLSPAYGSTLSAWDGSNYVTYSWFGNWWPSIPSVPVGASVWITMSYGSAPPPLPVSYPLPIHAGLNLIANQLDHGSNMLNEVMPGLPDGCVFSKYDNHGSNWIQATFSAAANSWLPTGVTLSPGEGGFLQSPTNFTCIFTGTPHVPVLPPTNAVNGAACLLSRQTNDIGSYENITGLSPSEGVTVSQWSGSNYYTYTFTGGLWSPFPPIVGVGQAIWISPAGGLTPPPVLPVYNYGSTLPVGYSLIANQLDHGSNTLDEVFGGSPVCSSCGTVLMLEKFNCSGWSTAQYYDAVDTGGFPGWYDNLGNPVTLTLAPGEGALAYYQPASGSNGLALHFTGTPHVPVLPASLPCGLGAFNALSRQTNDVGTYENITGYAPTAGAQVVTLLSSAFILYKTNIYTGSGWTLGTPSLAVGQSALFFVPGNSTPTYSLNIVAGLNLIANQLDHGSNELAAVMPNVPNGCVLYKYDNSSGTWRASFFDTEVWTELAGPVTLNPGEGAFLQSPTNFTLTFTGTPHVPVLPINIPNGATYLLSRQTNDIGSFSGIVGSSPPDNAQWYAWNKLFQAYTIYTKGPGSWSPSEPSAALGESVWISPGLGAGPLTPPPFIARQPTSLTVTQGQSASFSVTAASPVPVTYQWIFCPQPNWNVATNIVGATSATLTLPNVQPINAGSYLVIASSASGSVTSAPAALTVLAASSSSYTININSGYNLIANQLDHGSNTLDEILPSVPDGCVLSKFDNASASWSFATFKASAGGWNPGDLQLAPGQGAFLQSPTNFMLTFTGTPHVPVLPITIPSGATYLLSRQTNDVGNYTNIVGTPPTRTSVYKWTGSGYAVYSFAGGNWIPSAPTAAVGEALWIKTPGGPVPPPVPAGYSVSLQTGLNLIANQLDHGSNSLNEILPQVLDGSILYKYNNTNGTWTMSVFNGGLGSWTPANVTLNPGEGAFLRSPGKLMVTFTGTPHVPVLPLANISLNSVSLLSRQTNDLGSYDNIIGLPPQEGALLYRWDSVDQDFAPIFQYFAGYGWYPGDPGGPAIPPGEAVWVAPSGGLPPSLPASYTVNVHPGLNLIANQLDHGSNRLDEIMPGVPDGCVASKYDNASGSWTVAAYSAAAGAWQPGNVSVNPGEGVFLQSPAAFTLAFHGTPHVPVLPITIPNGATYLLGRQTNDIGTYDNIVGAAATNGAKVSKWTGSNYLTYTFNAGAWAPSAPSAAVGEAMWISPSGATAPTPTLGYAINIHSGMNLIANQLDHGSNMISEIFSTNCPDGCVLSKYNNAVGVWTIATYSAASGTWTPASLTLNPGEGAFLQSPANFMLTLTGRPHVPILPVSLPANACYLLSRQTNDFGTWTNIAGVAPTNGAKLYRWTGSNYVTFGLGAGAWSPSNPIVSLGESVWLSASGSSSPPPIIPSYAIDIHAGLNLIANHLDHGSNMLADIMPVVPDGSVLSKFDNVSGTWMLASYSAASHTWTPTNLTLNPGEGAFLQSPTNFTLYFTGTPHVPVLPVNFANFAGPGYLLSRQTNDIGTWDTIVGGTPPPLARMFIYANGWVAYNYDEEDMDWDPADPVVGVGQAVWISLTGGSPPAIPTEIRTYTLTIPNDGFVAIANQLDHGSNTLNEVLPNVPDGTMILKWDCASQDWSPNVPTYSAFTGKWSPNSTLAPGEGALISIGNGVGPSTVLTFTGTPHVPVLPPTFPCGYGKYYLLSRQTNDLGTFQNITGLVPSEGARLLRWSVPLQDFTVYSFTQGAWSPSNPPALNIGECAQFLVPMPTNPPVITQQPQSLTVTQGQTATFTVTATSVAPMTYQWIFCPQPNWNVATNILGATSSVLTLTNVQPASAGSYLVVVSSIAGSVTSAPAMLTVRPTGGAVVTATLNGGTLVLTWPGGGILQQSTNLITWVDVVGASSPYTVSPTAARMFYRVRQ